MPPDGRHHIDAQYCHYRNFQGRLLVTCWAVCYDAFERTRQKSKHIDCCLEIQPDLRLARSLHPASNPSQIPGEIQSFYSSQRKPDEEIWDKEEWALTSEVNDDELGSWASSLLTTGSFLANSQCNGDNA